MGKRRDRPEDGEMWGSREGDQKMGRCGVVEGAAYSWSSLWQLLRPQGSDGTI